MIYMKAAKKKGEDRGLPAHKRLLGLALYYSNAIGHAEFRDGALAAMVGVPPKNLGRVIRQLVADGDILPRSGARCIMLNPDVWEKGIGNYYCRHHGIGDPDKRPRAQRQPVSAAQGIQQVAAASAADPEPEPVLVLVGGPPEEAAAVKRGEGEARRRGMGKKNMHHAGDHSRCAPGDCQRYDGDLEEELRQLESDPATVPF